MDANKVGVAAAKAMEYIEREYGDDPVAEIMDVAIVLAIKVSGNRTVSHVESPEVPFYRTLGLLHSGIYAMDNGNSHSYGED